MSCYVSNASSVALSATTEMTSQIKLTLRPPPNVDFVHGYPGIPPALDRPQAAVKGAIEVRVGPAGVKAKWVRIELRKVETLPGGGQANTFYDFVGPSPVNLWTAGDDYGHLVTGDFPFAIRIPESIPPSIALENKAGIQYELVASACTKGKKGFFRSRKSVVVSTSALITIDKHELHSTWPVYCQPDTRSCNQDGVTLLVERNNSCFGPGDRVSVFATVKSDALHTVILRGFDMVLKETIVFRGASLGGKNSKGNAPITRVGIVDETKLAVNATLYGGTQHRSELAINISPRHATTTLNAARHIDVTYVLSVKALLGSGTHLVLDIPIIISNWQRNVSQEAIRRIGPAPSLSLTAVGQSPTQHNAPATYSGRSNQPVAEVGVLSKTLASSGIGQVNADDFGYNYNRSAVAPTQRPTTASSATDDDARASRAEERSQSVRITARSTNTGNTNPNSVTSTSEKEMVTSDLRSRSTNKPAWPTADDEKKKLYEKARAQVDRVQGRVASTNSPNTPAVSTSPAPSTNIDRSSTGRKNTPWPTAEEEKTRLFSQAKATAHSNQSQAQKYPNGSDARPSASSGSGSPGPASGSRQSPGAALYTNAMANVQRSSSSSSSPPRSYPTAEQEKEALKRYQEAKAAVNRTQQQVGFTSPVSHPSTPPPQANTVNDHEPVPYGSLYANGDALPSFEASNPSGGQIDSVLTEKERLRRAYAARDAEAAIPAYTPPADGYVNGNDQVLSEKEKLRRRYEAQDVEALGRVAPLQPTRSPVSKSTPINSRSSRPPPPPAPSGSPNVMSAMEEKALLRAKYEAEDASAQGGTMNEQYSPKLNGGSSHAPPPLMPRPPADYIKETQEEDARVSRYVSNNSLNLMESENGVPPPPLPPKPLSP